MRKTRRLISMLLIVTSIVVMVSPVKISSAALTNDLIEQKQDEIKQAESQIQSLKDGKSQVEDILDDLKDKKTDLESFIKAIDQSMSDVQSKIDSLEEEITQQLALVESARMELESAIETEQQQYEDMKKRIQFMYENGNTMYIEIIFSADSFSDFLTRAEYISRLTDYDQNMLEDYRATVDLVEMTKLQLEAQEELLEQEKASQEAEKEAYQELQAAKNQEMNQTSSEIKTAQQQISEYNDELQAMSDTIETLEAEIAAEKKRLLAANGSVLTYDGGTFQWPIAKYTKISSDYGYRIHPTLGVTLFHNGIDIASPYGTAIYAAYDGKVVAAAYTSVMGNYIMIDHGDGIYTVYMHCSKLYVSNGDVVVRGETIAAVGSTGRSTGNHLHFSVRVSGSYVSPWNYVKQP